MHARRRHRRLLQPADYPGLTVGAHSFAVRAIDNSNTPDATPATFTWTVGSPHRGGHRRLRRDRHPEHAASQNDLTDCGGFGLIVGASNITIDLNGHVIDGVDLDAGILNNGYDGVTITNGAISQFDVGIQLNPGTSGNVISNVRVESNSEAGILLSDADQAGQRQHHPRQRRLRQRRGHLARQQHAAHDHHRQRA